MNDIRVYLRKVTSYLVYDVQVQIKPTRREEKWLPSIRANSRSTVHNYFRYVSKKLSMRRTKLER
jgi:hypothetical protein